eukprot:TRINITY_DN4541_c0_g1_i2.p1 TRINITY_DN4541_c0_g1~~TRINITY_DN4541_c0_g1_i2.p1  ORF type:complete len:2240 (+),score=513.42 TRINITY_DN4541_c0_g1_i2:581-6721(+)
MEDMPVAPTVVKGDLESDCLKSGAANVTSGCVVLMGHGETNIIDEADDRDVYNATGAADPLPMHVEEVAVSKAAVPATSQESSSLKLLPSDAINASEEMPVAHIAVKQLSDESAFSLLGPAKVTSGFDLVSRHGEPDIIDEADCGKASHKTGVGSPHGKHYNEVSPMKDIMLPLSPERSTSSLLPNNATTALEEIPEVPIVVKERSQESGLSKLGLADVILGCVPIRGHGETGGRDVTDDGKAFNQTEVFSPDEKCVKEVTLSEKIISPVSQESSVPKLLTNDAIPAVEEIPVAPMVFMGKSQQSDRLKSGSASATAEKVFEMNLHTHNHMQINRVESSTQDVVSGCVLLKPCRKVAVTYEVDDIDRKASSRSKRTRALERSVKKITRLKGTLSSVSPQSDASQLLPTVTVEAIEKKAVAVTVVEEGYQESNLLKSGMANVASEGLKRSLRSHSRKHTNLVESSSQGAVSNYAILKQCREDTADLVDDGNGSNEIEVASACGNDDKVASKLKVTSVSVSPKSFPSELLLTGEIIAIEENPRALTIAEGGSQEVGFSITDMVDEASKEDFIRDLRPRLREHVSLVLTAAGWDVVIRERGHRPSYFDTLFATPIDKLICKLPKAWRSCGNNLFAGGIRSVQKQNMREWADINDFWNGLSITLTYIEKEMQETETPLSLAQRWRLLDPYVITVCIDRKIGALRSGKAVKVVNGVAVVSNTFVRTKRKYTKKNQIVGRFRDQVGSSDESLGPVPESDITSNQMDTCLSIVQSVAGHSECNTSASVRKRKRALSGDASAMTLSTLSPSEDLHMNLSVARESEVLHLEPSKSQDLKLDESILKSHCEDHQEERVCNGMIKLYKDEALAEDDTQGDFEDAMIPELQSSLFQSNPNSGMEYASTAIKRNASVEEMQKKARRKYGHTRKKFKSLLEVKGIKSISKHKKVGQAASPSIESHSSNLLYLDAEQEDFATGDFKKSRKLFGSMIASVHNGKLLIANQETEISMAEQQMSHLFPHENICHKADGSYQDDVLAHRKTQPHKNCCGVDDKIEKKLGLLFDQGKAGIAFGSNFARGSESATGREIAKMILSTGPELGLTKRSKKSRKISEIKATKSHSKHMHDLPMAHKVVSQNVDFMDSDKVNNGIIHGHSRIRQKCLMDTAWKGSATTSPVSSSQSQYMSSYKLKKFQRLGSDCKELVAVKNNGESQIKINCENAIDEASLHCATDESVDPRSNRKLPRMKKSAEHIENGRKGLRACPIDDDDLLIAAIIKNKDFSSKPNSKAKAARKLKSQKRSCKLLVRSFGKGGKMDMKFSTGKRTVLSWLLDGGFISVDDVIQYKSLKDGAVIKNGRVTRDGVFCKCCNKMLSVSEFKIHAGFKQYKPCLHLFLESGQPFTLCQLQAWSSEYKARKSSTRKIVDEVDQNDDTCGICGDGGELICCDNCPSTFHQSCLFAQELPEGSWYCSYCTCAICGDVVSEKEASSSLIGLQCSQCEHKYHKTCMNGEHMCKKPVSDIWFCGRNCQEIYSGLHSRIGVLNNISDGFSWMLLRCIHGDQKVHSAQRLALMAECNIKLSVALGIMEECFVPMLDPRTGINMIPQVLYNWGSDFARLNFHGFYTVVLEKDDEIISAASIRVHGVIVAEMPLIATCSEHRRRGMCRRLMNEIEEMLKSFKVQMLVISAIPDLVDTWTSGFGFAPIDDKEREMLNKINLMVFPGTTLLKKSLNGIEPVETKQTGLDVELSPKTEVFGEECACNEKSSVVPVLHSSENGCFVGTDIGENPALQNCKVFQLEEQPAGQLKYATQLSHGGSGNEVLSSVDHFSVRERIESLDICDATQLVSAKPVVAHEFLAANSIPNVSFDFPKEEFCGAYVGSPETGNGFVAGAIDANSLCKCDVASHNDEATNLADGELNQLQSMPILRQSSKYEEKLDIFAGLSFSAEKAHTAAFTNELLLNEQVDGSQWEPNNLHENHSHPNGDSGDFVGAVTTGGGTDVILASQTDYADGHIDSTHFRSIPVICKKHEDRIISCLLGDDHGHHDNASGREKKISCFD